MPIIREATPNDLETLVELNKLCFPTMVEEDVVWTVEPTAFAAQPERIDTAYPQCWSGLQKHFTRP